VRDNILMGLPYDEPHYTATLTACCLNTDLQVRACVCGGGGLYVYMCMEGYHCCRGDSAQV
jgi:hypothetical protein